jgi:hypothetical protein
MTVALLAILVVGMRDLSAILDWVADMHPLLDFTPAD